MTQTLEQFALAVRDSVQTRLAFELSQNENNDAMRKNMKDIDDALTDSVIVALFACNFDANTLNREERKNKRFNVKSFDKILQDVAIVACDHYSKHIAKTLAAFRDAEIKMSHNDAIAACSAAITHKDKSKAKILNATRYQKHVAYSTASTQASSSLNSLQALNIVRESRDDSNHVVYQLTDSDLCKRFVENALNS